MVKTKKMLHDLSVEQKIEYLAPLLAQIKEAANINEKLEVLNACPEVVAFLREPSSIRTFLAGLTPECDLAIKSILALGQGPIVFNLTDSVVDKFESLRQMLVPLLEVEKFYEGIGGIIGYHFAVLKLIAHKEKAPAKITSVRYAKPPGMDISKDTPEVRQAIAWSIEHLPEMAEIYPVGGAGDRLKLADEATGEMLPAAQLLFCGRTLLEGLIRDLQAREYLFYKVHGRQVLTPIAMMTSHEKDNHARILRICQSKNWFGRPESGFRLFTQPLVPVVCENGNWSLRAPLKLTLKPGGHGVIWKQALDEGVLDWLEGQNRRAALLRQINNPISGTDKGLLAFTGIGCGKRKAFGFSSCFRLLKAAEGMVVLIEGQSIEGFEYCITNIEYTDFQSKGVDDVPEGPGSLYSAFPANTNILFVDFAAVREALKTCTIPGMLINMKSAFPYIDDEGIQTEMRAGRLESTMQNIADHIVDKFPERLGGPKAQDSLKTYVTYNERRSTISVTKNLYVPGKAFQETPDSCFYDMHLNSRELLAGFCRMEVPECASQEDYLRRGPAFLFQYHPALGPLYGIIAQKIRKGRLEEGSELYLEISEADIENLHLSGSLRIIAESVMGRTDGQGVVRYSDQAGKCELHNVRVANRGIAWEARNIFWRDRISRHEALTITLQGSAEFYARDVSFAGSREITVPDGHRMEAFQREGKVEFRVKEIGAPTWKWGYSFDRENRLMVRKCMQAATLPA